MIERSIPRRLVVCGSLAPRRGGRGDRFPHRRHRARTRRPHMGNRSRVRSVALRIVQFGSWQFLFHECV